MSEQHPRDDRVVQGAAGGLGGLESDAPCEYTPGPWHMRDTKTRYTVWAGRRQVCVTSIAPYSGEYSKVGRSNALLIAAAPDLYAAAKALEEAENAHANCLECDGEGVPELCGRCFPLFDDARLLRLAALAKATTGSR